jgi:hypothetical protein
MTSAERNERRRRQLDRVRVLAFINGEPPNWPARAALLEREAQRLLAAERIEADKLATRMEQDQCRAESAAKRTFK